MMFQIGQEVECVDDSPSSFTGERHLCRGKIYVIEGFDNHPRLVGLFLAGVPITTYYPNGIGPMGWNGKRFRPVTKRKTDISIFTAMLTPDKMPVN